MAVLDAVGRAIAALGRATERNWEAAGDLGYGQRLGLEQAQVILQDELAPLGPALAEVELTDEAAP